MSILHSSIMGQSETLVGIDFTVNDEAWYETLGRWFVRGVLGGPVGAVMNIVEAIDTAVDIVGGFFTSDDGTTQLSLDSYKAEDYPDVLYLPFYTITAEEIFKGNITMFDVDFFNPKQVYVKRNGRLSSQVSSSWKLTDEGKKLKDSDPEYKLMTEKDFMYRMALRNDNYEYGWIDQSIDLVVEGITGTNGKLESEKWDRETFNKYITIGPTKASELSKDQLEDVEYYYYLDENGNEVRTSSDNTSSALSDVISKWYNALRNIALVLMMSILLYIGIRMLISTVSADKAKYKQMLVDWLVGMCLLFFMHYIMAFSVTLTNKFVEVINAIEADPYVVVFEDDEEELLSEGLEKAGYPDFVKGDKIVWPTNLMGKVRIAAEMRHGRVSFIGFALCFIVLVFYTVFFAFTYLKRVIYLAFLTIIAPFVAMTYPIDKVNDGQAQGFNKWLKEYIFNLLIQPLHLLLYTMLVSSVFSFASQNIWYMLVAIGFLIPAEKLLRSLFGFEKASTPGSLAGAAVGASLISNGVGKLLHKVPGGSHGRQGGNKELNNGEDGKNPRINFNDEDFDATNSLMPGIGLTNGGENENGSGEGKDDKEEGKIKEPNTEQALDRYKQDGFKQNTKGEYFNPYTDEYDANYNPLKDKNYMPPELDNSTESKGEPAKDKGNQILQNKQIPQQRKKTPRRTRIKRAMKVGARRVFTGKNVRRALTGVGKKGIRMAAGTALGVAAGTIGVAAGIASGDPSNALQYGMAGIGAGAVAGSRFAGATMDTVGDGYNAVKNSETRKAMTEAYYGDEEYKQKQQEKQIKEWKKNIEYKEKLERAIGEQQAKEMYEQGEIDEYLKHGITEIPDMAAMHELQDKGVANDLEEAVALHEYGERIGGDYKKLREKDRREWRETFSEEFQERGHAKDKSDKASRVTLDKIKEYHDIRKNIRTKL